MELKFGTCASQENRLEPQRKNRGVFRRWRGVGLPVPWYSLSAEFSHGISFAHPLLFPAQQATLFLRLIIIIKETRSV